MITIRIPCPYCGSPSVLMASATRDGSVSMAHHCVESCGFREDSDGERVALQWARYERLVFDLRNVLRTTRSIDDVEKALDGLAEIAPLPEDDEDLPPIQWSPRIDPVEWRYVRDGEGYRWKAGRSI